MANKKITIDDQYLSNFKVFDQYNITQFNKKDQIELLEDFLTSIENKIEKIQKNSDYKELKYIFHSMKSSAGNIGAWRLQECATKIDAALTALNDEKLSADKNWVKGLQNVYLEFKKEAKLFLSKIDLSDLDDEVEY
jgi:HPt (histidine-containing phosphotransfer) domain-containing protein